MINISEYSNFIWAVADNLRGDYKQADYGKVILPLTVIRRLDCVLADTKDKVLKQYETLKNKNISDPDMLLNRTAGNYNFHNHSQYDFTKLTADPDNIKSNLRTYLNGFSQEARDIIDHFDFDKQIETLDKADLLYQIIKRFEEVDLHPDKVSNLQMGYIFEELIRKFAEQSNETAGEHFTPREVIKLMVNLLFTNDRDLLSKKGIVKTLYDPACGTGGMLTVTEDYLHELNPDSRLELFGQEINPESYAICKSDMLITGHNAEHIKYGDTFRHDYTDQKFDYMLSNPPFGVNWKKSEKEVKKEYEEQGFSGRFGAGLPSISDGSLLFLQTMMSKMKAANGGSRIGIVFNGSPLFTGNAGSGPSNIRKWIIENDMLEAIVALPNQLFYNTGISTYIWIVTNRKESIRKGKIQLINSVDFYKKMSKSLGNKRNEISNEDIEKITRIYGNFVEDKYSKIFDNEDFGYNQITVERPAKDDGGNLILDKKGNPKPDSSLRDTENVPLKEDIHEYFKKEVLPHVPDAWVDESKTKIGYEISFTKYFYEFKPLRSLDEITKDIMQLEQETSGLLKEILS